MTNDNEIKSNNILKKWFITLGVFCSGIIVFKIIDGTILEPKLNKMGYFMIHVVGDKLEWFTFYHSPFLKFVTILFALSIIVMVIKDIVVFCVHRK